MRFELGLVVLCDLFVGRFRGQSGYSSGSKFPTLRCSKRVQASFVSVYHNILTKICRNPHENPPLFHPPYRLLLLPFPSPKLRIQIPVSLFQSLI